MSVIRQFEARTEQKVRCGDLGAARDYESGGQEFESLRARQQLDPLVRNLSEILSEMPFSRCVLLRLAVRNTLLGDLPRGLN
jgi:hypothetical protein